MAVGFDAITFDVLTGDGLLPLPLPRDDGPDEYTADVIVASAANLASLEALRSRITALAAIGFVDGGTLVVEAGAGVRTLTLPSGNQGETSYNAILVTVDARVHGWRADHYPVTLTWRTLGVAS